MTQQTWSLFVMAAMLAAAPGAAHAEPKGSRPPVLTAAGIGALKDGFAGGLAQLRKALPGFVVSEAVITDDEGRKSPGYEVRSGRALRFTLISQDGSIYLDGQPGLATGDGITIGSTFEQLAAVRRPHDCKGFELFKITVVCRFPGESTVYEIDDLKEKPKASPKALEAQLRGHKIGHIRWVGKGDLAVPKLTAAR